MPFDATKLVSSLRRALLKLHASGAEGFEGLIRDAFAEAAGLSGRIQKSSMQGGVDFVSDTPDDTVAIGVEAKRYKATTSLRLDDLKDKLFDASKRSGRPIELWILAASKEISGDDEAALKSIGDELGLGVLVLDWRSRGDAFAPLPLFLALAPNTVHRILGSALGRSIRKVAQHPEFEARKADFLRKIRHPDLGWVFAANAVRARIGQTLQTRADSRSRLQNSVDLRASGRIWAPRDAECEALTRWSDDPNAVSVCAVLGEEGAGKTWLLFDWWQRQAERDPPRLCVWFAAREVTSGSLAETLAEALAKWMPVPGRSATFWEKRVQRWRQAALANPGNGPVLWLMLDGTNEGTSQALVTRLLAEAADSDWRGAVRIVLTDRPGHWQSGLRSGRFIEPSPVTITLNHFRDAELETLLARHGKTRASFAPAVLSLIKWPSWFAVAAELFDQEHDWTAHSPEQLMLRYVQHRLGMRLNAPVMNDVVFREFLSELGRDIQRSWNTDSNFSRAVLKEKLSGVTGDSEKDILQAIDDVTSGVWFRSTGPHQFEIDEAILPLAIGLALRGELRSLGTEEEVDASVERFLGPMEDQSLGLNVLSAVISLTFLDATYPALATRVLLRRWITSHNFSNAHFQHLWRIGSVNPVPLLDVAEAIWMRRDGGSAADEILIKSIANVGGDGHRQSEVITFLAKWARTYWSDPREGQFIGYRPTSQQQAEAAAATQERLEWIRRDIGPDAFAELELIHADDGTSASWVFHRVNSIGTYLPRAAQASFWRGWVASRAVMGRENHLDDIAWSLRANPVDAQASTGIFFETVDTLLASPSAEIRATAISLLEAHGSQAALARIAAVRPVDQPSVPAPWMPVVSLVDGVVTFTGNEPPSEIGTISILSEFAVDPNAAVSPRHVKRLKRYASAFPVADLGDGRGRTAASNDLERAMPALARWAPRELIALYRRFLLFIRGRDETRLLGYTFSLEKLLILLTPPIQKRIRGVLAARRKSRPATKFDQVDHALVTAALFGSIPRDQIKLWSELGAPRSVLLDLKHVLRAPSPRLVKNLGVRLAPDQPVDQLAGWLVYLVLSMPKELPERWGVLAQLLDHQDSSIREFVFSIALNARNMFLAKQHLKSPWTVSAKRTVKENWYGASLLARNVTPASFKAIVERVGPEWSMIPWRVLKYRPDCSYAFEAFLKARVEHELNPPKSRALLGYRINHEEATKKLLEQKPGELVELADKLFAMQDDPAFARYEFPRRDLVQAFLELHPAKGAQYWTKLSHSEGPFQPGEDIEQAPFEVADGDDLNELRRCQIMDANNDWKLLTFATFILRYKRTAWAITLIRQLLLSTDAPGDVARAVTLAGFLDDSPGVRSLWRNELAAPPIGGWIGRVHQDARQNIQKTWMCLEWLDVALAAKGDERFFAAWELFAHSCERSTIPVAAQRIKARLKSRSQRQREFIALRWEQIQKKSMKSESQLKDRLFSFRVGHSLARPWSDR
ncbi:hypothetical protein M2175_001132 [Bradyrhizobium elkanii]|uniref:hypothetical protein n=1 Tax=Bradyrhizobium TaxID=374 RepID=UPI00216851A5|nr:MULTISPECIES: hypothetical protein [Bradyrhizobium]MCS3926101.1 hypothetical protein [Bradyrhizobium elkanii]MCS3966653.1 hypothetical protein [Bradyrhizobium japonicum]